MINNRRKMPQVASKLFFLTPRSFQAELLAAEAATLRRGVSARPAPRRCRPLSLPYGVPPAGGAAADVPERLLACVE